MKQKGNKSANWDVMDAMINESFMTNTASVKGTESSNFEQNFDEIFLLQNEGYKHTLISKVCFPCHEG